MRPIISSLWLVAVLLLATTQYAAGQADLIVKIGDSNGESGTLLRDATSKQAGRSVDQSYLMAGVVDVTPVFSVTSLRRAGKSSPLDGTYRVTLSDSSTLRTAQIAWAKQPDVEYAIFNHRYSLEQLRTPEDFNDTHFDSLSHLPLIRAPEAWAVTRGASSVRVGVIDTGVFKDHPDLIGQFWVNTFEDLNGNGVLDDGDLNGIDDDANGYIDDVVGYDFVDRAQVVDQGDYLVRDPDASEDRLVPSAPRRAGFSHGTLVSGVISAALDNGIGVAGVSPGAKLVPIRAFGIDGLAEDDDVAAAIVYAADVGIDVINLSFGDTYYSPLMADAVRYATSQGTVIVASGGNVGTDAPHYPSDYPEAIGALWLDKEGLRRGSRASFGTGVDVGAPASFVFTTLMPSPDESLDGPPADSVLYGYRSGSSLAAPQISGAVALLRSVDPDLSPASMKAILTSTALDLGDPGWDHETASGRVDIAAALGLPYPASVSISSPQHNAGFTGGQITIEGSVLSSLFDSYSLWYGEEREGEEPSWELVAGPITDQKRMEVLASWNLDNLADTTYILRLEVLLANGQTVEDRRRIYIDHTPPEAHVIIADAALIGPHAGIQLEVESDDLSDVTMIVQHNGTEHAISSDRATRRHGHTLTWTDPSRKGGTATVQVEISNVAGLTTVLSPIVVDFPGMPNPGFLQEFATTLPAGYLLPHETDLDADGLPEVVFNRYREGWLGDTLRVAEWAGGGFRTSIDI
ncbi:S8 family serine peptidase, partial [Bacteroidota bacterium]